MQRAFTLICAAVLLATPAVLFASGSDEGGASADELTAPGIFPVQPEISMVAGHTWTHDPDDNPWVQSWRAPTGVNLEWVLMDSTEKMSIVFASDDYPDMMFGVTGLHKNLIAQLQQEGMVTDLRQYLNGYTPNLDQIFAEEPERLAYMTFLQREQDRIMNLQHCVLHTRIQGSDPMICFLLDPVHRRSTMENLLQEGVFAEKPEALAYLPGQNYMNNRRWFDALGLNAPTTEELRDVLIAFRDGDPNGNGKADEATVSDQ